MGVGRLPRCPTAPLRELLPARLIGISLFSWSSVSFKTASGLQSQIAGSSILKTDLQPCGYEGPSNRTK